MISQRCPKCRSSRIRKGYKPTPLILRLVGIHYLLCNHCNLLFTGFAVPGTASRMSKRARKKAHAVQQQPTVPKLSPVDDS
jgi:hypothetical protein